MKLTLIVALIVALSLVQKSEQYYGYYGYPGYGGWGGYGLGGWGGYGLRGWGGYGLGGWGGYGRWGRWGRDVSRMENDQKHNEKENLENSHLYEDSYQNRRNAGQEMYHLSEEEIPRSHNLYSEIENQENSRLYSEPIPERKTREINYNYPYHGSNKRNVDREMAYLRNAEMGHLYDDHIQRAYSLNSEKPENSRLYEEPISQRKIREIQSEMDNLKRAELYHLKQAEKFELKQAEMNRLMDSEINHLNKQSETRTITPKFRILSLFSDEEYINRTECQFITNESVLTCKGPREIVECKTESTIEKLFPNFNFELFAIGKCDKDIKSDLASFILYPRKLDNSAWISNLFLANGKENKLAIYHTEKPENFGLLIRDPVCYEKMVTLFKNSVRDETVFLKDDKLTKPEVTIIGEVLSVVKTQL